MRRRSGRAARPAPNAAAGSNGILRFYTDDAPGLLIGPTTVLVLSLLFIGMVVVMHMAAKVGGGSSE
jgi:protein transport protein SEC61 subunit beta